MNTFVENPWPIVIVGGCLAIAAGIAFVTRQSLGAMVALVTVLAITGALLVVERVVVTDRELIETGISGVMAEIKQNNVEGVLNWIDPDAADVRADVAALMPQVKVDNAHAAGRIEVELNESSSPPTATSQFLGVLFGVHPASGARIGYYNQKVELRWIKRGERWLITGYTAYYDGKAHRRGQQCADQ